MRHLLPVLVLLMHAVATLAVSVVDQSHIVTQSTGAELFTWVICRR